MRSESDWDDSGVLGRRGLVLIAPQQSNKTYADHAGIINPRDRAAPPLKTARRPYHNLGVDRATATAWARAAG
jgi:hypothetical protein